jgi:hypothetical protein
MEALKRVAADFVQERPNDRIGLVVYLKLYQDPLQVIKPLLREEYQIR